MANGGTGTATPGIIAGTNITSITGAWPNQTINAATQSGSGGGSSTLGFNQNAVSITTPTLAINAIGPPFIITAVGGGATAQMTLDGSSVTMRGQAWSNTVDASTLTLTSGVFALGQSTFTLGQSTFTLSNSTASLFNLANGKVGLSTFTATQPILYNNVTGVYSSTLISATTGFMGTLQAAQEPAHTGDVTNSAASLAMTAAANQPNITTLSASSTSVTGANGLLVSNFALVKGSASVTGAGGVNTTFGVVAATFTDKSSVAHAVAVGEGNASPMLYVGPGGSGLCLMGNGAGSDPTFQACPSGQGGGITIYSSGLITPAATQFFPPGGGLGPSTTETNVDVESSTAATVSNFYVQLSVALGLGNTTVFTWRKNGADTVLNCTITGASATSCNDTTDNFTVAQGDLIDVKAVTSGSVIVTPNVVMDTQFGTNPSGGGGSGTPAGASGQLQFNNGGAFGGVSNSTVSANSISVDTISAIGFSASTITVKSSATFQTSGLFFSAGTILDVSSTTDTNMGPLILNSQQGTTNQALFGHGLSAPTWQRPFKVLASTFIVSAATTTFPVTIQGSQYLLILVGITGYSGNDIASLTFNADRTATNYQTRHVIMSNAGTPVLTSSNTTQTSAITLGPSTIVAGRVIKLGCTNASGLRKICTMQEVEESTSQGTMQALDVAGGEWFNTTTQITNIEMRTQGGNNMNAGSGFIVLGADY